MNRLLQMLRTQHSELSAEYDEVLNRCADENLRPVRGREWDSPKGCAASSNRSASGSSSCAPSTIADTRRLPRFDDYPELPGSSSGTGAGEERAGADRARARRRAGLPPRHGGPDGSLLFFRDLMFRSREGDPGRGRADQPSHNASPSARDDRHRRAVARGTAGLAAVRIRRAGAGLSTPSPIRCGVSRSRRRRRSRSESRRPGRPSGRKSPKVTRRATDRSRPSRS